MRSSSSQCQTSSMREKDKSSRRKKSPASIDLATTIKIGSRMRSRCSSSRSTTASEAQSLSSSTAQKNSNEDQSRARFTAKSTKQRQLTISRRRISPTVFTSRQVGHSAWEVEGQTHQPRKDHRMKTVEDSSTATLTRCKMATEGTTSTKIEPTVIAMAVISTTADVTRSSRTSVIASTIGIKAVDSATKTAEATLTIDAHSTTTAITTAEEVTLVVATLAEATSATTLRATTKTLR